MPKYTPSFIDTSSFVKAFNDELYRQAVLNSKKNDALDKHFDTEYKMYSGKVRKQDLAEFDSKFAQYQLAAKGYQKANRGNGYNVSSASQSVSDAKNEMLGYIQDSATLGEYGKNLNKYRTEAKNLVDREKLDNTLMDASTLTASEFKEKYGDSTKWAPLVSFEFNPKDVDISKLNGAIKKTFTYSKNSHPVPSIDDNGNQKSVSKTISYGTNPNDSFTIDVPLIKVSAQLDPEDVLFSVKNAGISSSSYGNYYKNIYNKTMEDMGSQNPAVQIEVKKKFDDIKKLFPYIKDTNQITPEHLYASQFINENNLGDVEIEDWKTANQKISAYSKMKGLSDKEERMNKMRADIDKQKKNELLKTVNTASTLLLKARAGGLLGDDSFKQKIKEALSSVDINITDATFKKMSEAKLLDINDISDLILSNGGIPQTTKTPARKSIYNQK